MILEKIQVKFSEAEYKPYFDDDKESRNVYTVTMIFNGKQVSYTFGDSINNTQKGELPDKNGIIETMTSDYYYTIENYPNFEDFAGEFGYDKDSIKAEKIYKACLFNGVKFHKLFSDEDIEQIRKELDI